MATGVPKRPFRSLSEAHKRWILLPKKVKRELLARRAEESARNAAARAERDRVMRIARDVQNSPHEEFGSLRGLCFRRHRRET